MPDATSPYRVQLDIFDGPLDLLLHLCRKQEVDIRDISIATVTDQYLQYLDLMKRLNLEVAGAYLATAANLCHIKSLALLPREVTGEEGEQGPDPREDLIRQLLEYQRYKEAAGSLAKRTLLDRDTFEAPAQDTEVDDGERPIEGSLFAMLEALRDLLAERGDPDNEHRVEVTRYTIADRMRAVVERMRYQRKMDFKELFDASSSREQILTTFLALLEMVRMQLLTVVQEAYLDPIQLRLDYRGTIDDLPVPGEEESP